MAKASGSDVVSMRAYFRQKGKEAEGKMLAKLDPEVAQFYKTTLYTNWENIEKLSKVYEAAAEVLYSGTQGGVFELGKEMARRSYSGVMKIFLMFPTIKYVISRAANIWNNFYDTGKATIENYTDGYAEFVVRNFPEMTPALRTVCAAHITVLLEMTGCRDTSVTIDETNPAELRWKFSWK